jgi:hypothetical protein
MRGSQGQVFASKTPARVGFLSKRGQNEGENRQGAKDAKKN